MPLPLEEHVRLVLLENERGVKFHRAIDEGWRAFADLYPQRHGWIRKSSARHMAWEEIARRLSAVAVSDPGIIPVRHRDTLSLVVEDEVLFRLKHADTALVTQNYPTTEAELFDNHDVDLYGFNGLQRVRLCYVLDQFETKVVWIGVAAHDNGRFLWKIELDGAGAVAAPPVLPFVDSDTDTAKLARLKKSSDETAKKKKDNG